MVSFSAISLLCTLLPAVLAQTKIRYMPFGDSITEIVCWRSLLWQRLQQDGYTNVDFVGSMTTDQCNGQGGNYDKNHEGHSGFQAVNIANQNQLVGWLQQNPADIITMHLGTNDVFYSRSTNEILTAFSKLIDQMRASNPRMRIIVAQIIPASFSNNLIIALNAAIPAWAQGKNSTASPIYLVDQYTGFSTSDLRDGVHPNANGDQKLFSKWYPALVQAIKSLQSANTRTVEFIA